MNWLNNTVDVLWIKKERGLLSEVKAMEKKVHLVHHLLHLAYGSAVLGLSVLVHVIISHHLQNTARMVHWQAGEVESGYVLHGTTNMGPVEFGVVEDGTVVWRIKK